MALIVQKYGGTSVATPERIKEVAKRVAAVHDRGDQIVVVVSAMGDATDDLISLAAKIAEKPSPREMDVLLSTGELVASALLAMALNHMGYKAISLSGAQAGIKTDSSFRKARISKVEARRIQKELAEGYIVIVAGFQGITDDMEITTLGRGGSDTSAVALAGALGAKVCERLTDTDGIYTADPRVVKEAKRVAELGYEEMLELATYGNKVMQPRAIELAQLYNVPIYVASSFNNNPGTLIHGDVSMEVRNKVKSVALDMDVAKITVVGVPDKPGIAAAIFVPLAKAGISVDTIVQNASINKITDLTFTVTRDQMAEAVKAIKLIARKIGAKDIASDNKLGKVSIVGTGMQNTPGFAARMFATLNENNINIELITTSEIRITCIIAEDRVKEAVKALHKAFEVELG
ncbi:MAG TPA: aspartate kinase [Dehalococcoidales bacterium]|nr:aspartate kinase [Dehalococcoidales bacterium]